MPELERGLGRIQGALDQVSNEAERDHGLRDQPRAHISEVEPTTDEATTPVSESGGSESPRHANIDAFDIRNPVACNDAVLVQATLPVKCRLDCTSQRHFQTTDYCSPSWLKPVLGSIFLSYQDHPSLGHGKCNQTTCCRSQTQGHLSYYFSGLVVASYNLAFGLCVEFEQIWSQPSFDCFSTAECEKSYLGRPQSISCSYCHI